MLDILSNYVIKETLDAHMTEVVDKYEAVESFSKRLRALSYLRDILQIMCSVKEIQY